MSNLLNTPLLCIAHRGAASLAPENTLAAAGKALAVGAEMWELDVSVTAEGELVVLHDNSLARTTNVRTLWPQRSPWLITSFTLAELKTLDAGSWFVETDPFGTIAGGAITPAEQQAYRGEPIPTLPEALAFAREHSWRVNVEIKELLPPLLNFPVVEKVVKLIESLGMVEQVLLSSFVHSYMRQAKTINSAIATAALFDEGEMNFSEVLSSTGSHFEAVHPHFASVAVQNIQALRQAGVAVNPWTVDDPAEMQRLIRAGITGLITNFPQILRLRVSQ